ncbi:hypothetical protein [Halogeometricum luteum]|uniref:PIN domain-containing protein n=1 Tax=Halogeometricum luteum TaxID=2950537 RepID=A0ABU2G5P9_9EURY|nr:hypothetical protein [Halogeometricum sp. S3BR5-2]MDS0296117.1 hypothetical protein [Halogeometricum sp. S3BR5-2]
MQSKRWELYVEDNVLVADFHADMDLTDEMFAEVNERFEKLASRPAVDTHVSVLEMESPLNSDVFERANEAAEAGVEFGIDRWIIVSDTIKNMALRSRIDDLPEVEVLLADDKAEAMRMATR